MSNSIEARIISITGQEVYRIIGNTKRGAILSADFEWEKVGGLRNFEITIARNNAIPLFSGMRFDFYYRDEVFLSNSKIFTGYSEIVPNRETNNNFIVISGKGYYWKLAQRLLNNSYTSQSLQSIILSLDLTGLDISFSPTEINPPSGTYTVDFKDKSYIKVLDTLLKISNSQYSTIQYIYGINENRELYFKQLPSTGTDVAQKYFEGYNFQNPEVEFNDDIVNKVQVYRATLADAKETELVNTYEDTNSQGIYGEYEKKITVSDYIDDTAAEDLADSILQEKSVPKKMIRIDNFYRPNSKIIEGLIAFDDGIDNDTIIIDVGSGTEDFEYRMGEINESSFARVLVADYYGISTKPQEKITLVNECDSLTGWTQSISDSIITVENNNVLTGRQSFKWTRDASKPAGDYIEFELESVISNLIDVRFNIYFVDTMTDITVSFFDIDGNQVDINPDVSNVNLVTTWLKFIEETQNILETGALEAKSTGTIKKLGIKSGGTEYGIFVTHTDAQSIRNLAKVRITLGTGTLNSDVLYIDRIETKNKSWEYSRLTLDKAKYSIDKDYIIGNLEFGDKKISLIDELKTNLDKGAIAFDMYAKE